MLRRAWWARLGRRRAGAWVIFTHAITAHGPWQAGVVSSFDEASTTPDPSAQDLAGTARSAGATAAASTDGDVETLVGAWLTVPDVAERLAVKLSEVRRMINDRELVALRTGPRRVVSVPERFVTPDGPVPTLRGTVTVLADGGMNDEEIVHWLFTPDETLPVPGAPLDALLAGHKKEVRRRAQELAF